MLSGEKFGKEIGLHDGQEKGIDGSFDTRATLARWVLHNLAKK